VSALHVLEVLADSGHSLADRVAAMEQYPQVMINVPIATELRDALASHARVQQAVADAEQQLGGRGRVVLRPSGTEPVVRVMVEGRQFEHVKQLAHSLSEVLAEQVQHGDAQ
ncbi:MAG: phosphoglucosamine mutase, partial [Pseudomonadota bacterium]